MSLVDPKETRVFISGTWKPTTQEVKEFFEKEGLFKAIQENLETDENQTCFEKCLKENFSEFTNKSVAPTKRMNFMWLLNTFSLKEDVKTNVAIYISMRIADKQQTISEDKIKEILQAEELVKEVIYDLKETLAEELQGYSNSPKKITALRVKKARTSRVLLSNKIKTEMA